jgi:hypothetical protein
MTALVADCIDIVIDAHNRDCSVANYKSLRFARYKFI